MKTMAKITPATKAKLASAFHEVKHDTPAVVKATARKKGPEAARKQKIAIALSKARAAGAKIPAMSKGIKKLGAKK